MNDLRSPDDSAAVGFTDALLAEADAEHRYALAPVQDQLLRQSSIGRGARSRADQDAVRFDGLDPGEVDRVVAVDYRFRTQFADVLDEVVDEGVVVVDDEYPGSHRDEATTCSEQDPASKL